MRKNELLNLKADMIQVIDNRVEIRYIGKGGKHNRQIYLDEKEKAFVISLKNGKEPHERIFSKEEVQQARNLHKARELRCKTVYDHVTSDIAQRGEVARQGYIKEIKHVFSDAHKPIRENLDNPYVVRGTNRQRLIDENRPVEYSRVALLFVSVTVSQHFRSDTTANHNVVK